VKLYNDIGVIGEKPMYFFLERYKGAFIEEMISFTDAVLNSKPVAVNGEDGLENMYAALAAGLSLKENRPVKIAEIKLL
jgi:myo-inositol 2-dehydrogenase/D-chiro-inositol 1-dehydrogenase